MSLSATFPCLLVNGLHARPASQVMRTAEKFASEILLVNHRTGHSANARSVLSLITGDFRFNDKFDCHVEGTDETLALKTLERLLTHDLPGQEQVLEFSRAKPSQLPRCLINHSSLYYQGQPLVDGIAEGALEVLPAPTLNLPDAVRVESVELEKQRLLNAIQVVRTQLHNEIQHARGAQNGILNAHIAIACDPVFEQDLLSVVEIRGTSALSAISSVRLKFEKLFTETGNPILKERVADLRDLCDQLAIAAYLEFQAPAEYVLSRPTILYAQSLTPQRFLSLNRNYLRGLILREAETTSHVVVLARSFDIPLISGVLPLTPCSTAILDGRLGLCVPNPTAQLQRFFNLENKALKKRRSLQVQASAGVAETPDGTKIEVLANVSTAEEVELAHKEGMNGVGLFRTEMLFLGRKEAPGEAEQYEHYTQSLKYAAGRPVTFRLIDWGGDKTPEYLRSKLKPFSESRGAQLYPQITSYLQTQLRALLRAAVHGPAKILVPMVCSENDMVFVKKLVDEIRIELRNAGIPCASSIPIGAMIETRSAASQVNHLAPSVDFFSVGSNDLAQSFSNHSFTALDPEFWRVLTLVTKAAQLAKKPISICGELAAERENLHTLIGMGMHALSVSVPNISKVKTAIRKVPAVKSLTSVTATTTGEELLCADMIVVESESSTQGEALRELANLLFSAGRTDSPEAIEAALWERELQHSTGFGHGFAIPHCKSKAISLPSIAILKLKTPVSWNAMDNLPVRALILLATPKDSASNQHLSIFSKLARNLMDETFRNSVLRTHSPKELMHCILSELKTDREPHEQVIAN